MTATLPQDRRPPELPSDFRAASCNPAIAERVDVHETVLRDCTPQLVRTDPGGTNSMIIFGTRGYLYQLAILTLVCGRCGNPSAHTLRKRVTKFTLFFVPLFPISSKYATQCTFCGAEQKATKEQAEQLQAQAASAHAAQQYGQPQQPQQPYQA
ncbi:zinc-ribbon family protein [Streptomyces sp. OV198]|nr:zinc ribbon family protein [Streptomyces sp. Ag82_O1-15]SOE77805.1 zinc-ribbon family protein [Streptomyces sp. OV198]